MPTQISENTASQKPRRWKVYLIRGILTLLVIGVVFATGMTYLMKMAFSGFQPPMASANVVVTPAENREFRDMIEAIGTITADKSAVITTTVTEVVKSINAEEGEFVAKGTPIVRLDDDDVKATLQQASRSYKRYNELVKDNLASAEKRDSEQANLNIARAQADKRNIVAPFDGFLGIRHVNVGDVVQPGTVITTIDAIDPIKLDFTVPEIYLASLKKGLSIEATSTAYPDDIFNGEIYVVDSRVDEQSHAIMARAIMQNPEHKLKPGMMMKVKIIRDSHSSVAIPEDAIQAAGEKKSVLVVGADNKVSEKEIVTGMRQPGLVEVKSGLAAGEKVIVEGQMKTGAGASVNIAEERKLNDVIGVNAAYAIPRKQDILKQDDSINIPQKDEKNTAKTE